MFRIVYGGFRQETNTFSPLICRHENFEAGGIYDGPRILEAMKDRHDHASAMVKFLQAAPDVELMLGAD